MHYALNSSTLCSVQVLNWRWKQHILDKDDNQVSNDILRLMLSPVHEIRDKEDNILAMIVECWDAMLMWWFQFEDLVARSNSRLMIKI